MFEMYKFLPVSAIPVWSLKGYLQERFGKLP